eukprot:SAG11_NODE_942_length_6435_cov_27.522096_2_plen_239_part_00
MVTIVHVKGHSVDGGNERADELCWWAKEAGPYVRISEDVRGGCGGTEGDCDSPFADYEGRRVRRQAAAAKAKLADKGRRHLQQWSLSHHPRLVVRSQWASRSPPLTSGHSSRTPPARQGWLNHQIRARTRSRSRVRGDPSRLPLRPVAHVRGPRAYARGHACSQSQDHACMVAAIRDAVRRSRLQVGMLIYSILVLYEEPIGIPYVVVLSVDTTPQVGWGDGHCHHHVQHERRLRRLL